MTRPGLVAELFAGTAAFTRCVLGAPMELVAWLGGKRRAAPTLVRAAGLRPGIGAEAVFLSDAGTWGWVWPILLDPALNAAVVTVLRRWAQTCPACEGSAQLAGARCPVCVRAKRPGGGPDASDLWAWLASQPPRSDLAERTAGWLWLQARSASGAPVWWDESRWSQGSANGAPPQPAGQTRSRACPPAEEGRDPRWRKGQTAEDHAREQFRASAGRGTQEPLVAWVASDGRGVPRPAGQRTTPVAEPTLVEQQLLSGPAGDLVADARWRIARGAGQGADSVVSEKGRGTPTRGRGIIYPSTLADRIEALGRAKWPVSSAIFHCSAEAAAELVASFLVLQSANGRGRPVEIWDGAWRTAGFAHLTESARAKGFETRLRLPRLAERAEGVQGGGWPSTSVLHDCATQAVSLVAAAGSEAVAVIDPPYHRDGDQDRDRTGYGWDLPLARSLEIATRLADAGARVLFCEGGPLDRDLGPGWHAYDITGAFSGAVKGREWLTVNARVDLGLTEQRALFPLTSRGAA